MSDWCVGASGRSRCTHRSVWAPHLSEAKTPFPPTDPGEPYLDQRALDDSAHVQPPLRHIRVVVVQVWWKGQQMRFEIFCREVNMREMMWVFICHKTHHSHSRFSLRHKSVSVRAVTSSCPCLTFTSSQISSKQMLKAYLDFLKFESVEALTALSLSQSSMTETEMWLILSINVFILKKWTNV